MGFLEAEMNFMSQSGYSIITVEQVLEQRSPHTLAKLIQKELPARYATRILEMGRLGDKWQQIPGLKEMNEILRTSFSNLRLVNFREGDLQPFTEVIKDLRKRHKPV